MATIDSNGTGGGSSSAGSSWDGGVVPVEGDKVNILSGDTITLDSTHTWGDDAVSTSIGSAAINLYGTLRASRSASSSLTILGNMCVNWNAEIDFGKPGDEIPLAYTVELVLNKRTTPSWNQYAICYVNTGAASGYAQSLSFCGDPTRTPIVTLAQTAAASQNTLVMSSAAHGWQVGDELLLPNTTNMSSAYEDEFATIASIDGASITLSGNLTYAHIAGAWVGNLTRNIKVRPYTLSTSGTCGIDMPTVSFIFPLSFSHRFRDVEFYEMGGAAVNNPAFRFIGGVSSWATVVREISRCSYKHTLTGSGTFLNNRLIVPGFSVDQCVIYTPTLEYNNYIELKNSLCIIARVSEGAMTAGALIKNENCWFGGNSNNNLIGNSDSTFENCIFAGRQTAMVYGVAGTFINCDCGYTFGWRALYNDYLIRATGSIFIAMRAKFVDCLMNDRLATPCIESDWVMQSEASTVEYVNRNNDGSLQEIYRPTGTIRRENTIKNKGESSLSFNPIKVGSTTEHSFKVPCISGGTVRLIGYFRLDSTFYNSGDCTLPTVTVSGLAITPVTHTATSAANGAWEQFDIQATNGAGYDGSFTVTVSVSAKTVAGSSTGGMVYFDGVNCSPFITKVRHYGYRFDETNPSRVVNPNVSANEATAAAYTGCTIDTADQEITFSAGTIDTWQKLYDYSQAWGVANVSEAMPFALAGASLLLADGWTVIDPPSLTGAFGWASGTIQFTSTGTKNVPISGSVVDFAAAGSYSLTGQLSGTIELTNSSGGAVTVALPSGTSYTNTGPNITVTLPVPTLTLTGLQAGSEVRAYVGTDPATATEIDGVESSGTSFTFSHEEGGNDGYIVVHALGYESMVIDLTYSSSDQSIPVSQRTDRWYSNPA